MNVGILVWDLNINGGTQRQALELACQLQSMGVQVVVYCYLFDPSGCYPDLCSRLDIRHVRIEPLRRAAGKVSERYRALEKYSRIYFEVDQKALLGILDDDLDVLNAHDYRIYPAAGRWREKTGRPVVWTMNDMPMYRRNGKRPLKTALFHIKPKFREYIRSFDRIVVLDHINGSQVERNFGRSAEIVRSGIDVERFPYRDRDGGGEFRLLSTGIFLPYRRIEDTISALSMLVRKGHNISLDHIGSDDRGMAYAKMIYSMVKESGLQDRVRFHGRVSEQRLLQLFSEADAFVFPNAPQTWGLSVFEAMACGLPVVLTTGCGASEVLADGVDAVIVEAKSPAKLADAVERLYTDKEWRKRLARQGRDFVENNMSWKKYAESMFRIFREVASGWAAQ